ncbi:MAG: hypothetical protein Q7U82_10980 [Gammaproteobacteria bacterium]|nr:hypothetical protein [Gammaproteobacteria bacterium]
MQFKINQMPDMKLRSREEIIDEIAILISMHKRGLLGGDVMPEDARPKEIDVSSRDNFHFLTLPMALNYQRNSYTLWKAAAITFLDQSTVDIFDPRKVVLMDISEVREKLTKHKLALQPNKHIDTWMRISTAINKLSNGDIRELFKVNDLDVIKLRKCIQVDNKKDFPYLSGSKIFNYWLYVMGEYTPLKLTNRQEITIAPDTHIIQASIKLGVTSLDLDAAAINREIVSNEWNELLRGTGMLPIDIHTPLWLWSRAGFPDLAK